MEIESTPDVVVDEVVDEVIEAADEVVDESVYEPTLEEILSDSWSTDEDDPEEPELDTEPVPVADEELFTVKVNGEEIQVTREEALAGYQRQADYTRKTQALAPEREELAAYKRFDQALQDNPEAALRMLAAQLQIDLGAPSAPTQPVDDVLDGIADPLEREVRELRQQIERITSTQESDRVRAEGERARHDEAQRLAAVDTEIESLRSKVNDPKFDETAVLQFALDNSVGNLEIAYRAMKAIEGETAAAAEAQRIAAAKRSLPPVEGGRARTAGSTRSGATTRMTVEQAFAAAENDFN